MDGLSDYAEVKVLDIVAQGTTFTAPATSYISLHTALLVDAATGAEVSGNAYARLDVTAALPAAAGAGGSVTSNVALTWSAASPSAWGEIISFGIWDASSAGNLIWRGIFGDDPYGFTATASDDVVITHTSAYAVNDRVVVYPVPGRSLPTGLSADTIYYILTVPTAGSYTLSATQGGATINITANGSGLLRKLTPQTVNAGNTFQINSGSLKLLIG